MTLNGQRYPRVNIVSTDYARYGTSVYQKLYNRNDGSGHQHCGYGAHYHHTQDNGSITGSFKSKPDSIRGVVSSSAASHDENPLMKTSTFGSSVTSNTAGGNDGSLLDDGKSVSRQSVDTASMVDNGDSSSKRSKIKKKYKSLISSSSKKFISKLHEHGSSDTFSIFSLRTSQSHKNELLRSEHIIYERKYPPNYADFSALPVEIIATVLMMLGDGDQMTLVKCLYVSKVFYKATKMVLYRSPKFTSTYRVAQFVTSLRIHSENGRYVKILDLSHLKNGLVTDDDSETNGPTSNSNSNFLYANADGLPDALFDDTDYEFALAGWRDWRYRHDPLYGATILNSFNLKKVVSRSSSISSQVTSSTVSSPGAGMTTTTNTQSYSSSATGTNSRRHRSNSSVSSFTSSIMSSFHNNSHVSLASTTSTNTSVNPATNFRSENGIMGRKNKSTNKNDNGNNNTKTPNRDSIWFKLKIGSKNRARLKNKRLSNTSNAIGSHEKEKICDYQRNKGNSMVKFNIEQPFRTHHPYTNKFLLKYAPYRDIPIGYVLHILKVCPNITHLNLSNLVFCSDFELVGKKPKKIMACSSLLPAVQESVISSSKSEAELEVIYLTDSNKNYDYYNDSKSSHSRRSSTFGQNPNSFLNSSSNTSDYPLPIEGQSKRRHFNRQSNNTDVQLRKLNPTEVFEYLSKNHSVNALKDIKMDGIVWCRQTMIKYFILKTFTENDDKKMNFSFANSGLNMNLVWTCMGDLQDFVTLLVMDEIYQMDDLALEELFNVSKGTFKSYGSYTTIRDSDIVDVSNIFTMGYGLNPEKQEKINFRVTILKTERPTCYRIRRLSPNHISLVVSLCLHESSGEQTRATESEFTSEPSKRIDHITHDIVNRICELRSIDLRRNLGENNYVMEDIL